ncbi:MAG: SDR family oxidoreductase [Planctomycetota bacterium]|nr:MAG: SDR family oxidoreductase [Planctomycetota bacterium]
MTQLRVFITGGGRGIGRSIAVRFAREGAKVAIAARNSEQLDAVVAEIDAAGGEGYAVQMDIADHNSAEAAVFRATEFFDGTMDLLVNNAGIFSMQPFEELTLDVWQRFLNINLTGPFVVTLEALGALQESERPHIINMCSIAAKQGFAGNVGYCASKYGLRGFSDALREDLRAKGIRVSTIYPSATDTSMLAGVPGDWDKSKLNQPEDVAEVVWKAYHMDSGYEDLDV